MNEELSATCSHPFQNFRKKICQLQNHEWNTRYSIFPFRLLLFDIYTSIFVSQLQAALCYFDQLCCLFFFPNQLDKSPTSLNSADLGLIINVLSQTSPHPPQLAFSCSAPLFPWSFPLLSARVPKRVLIYNTVLVYPYYTNTSRS